MRQLSADEFRDVIGRFASGVTVITAAHNGRLYGTTASAVTSLSLEPPMILVSLSKQSETGQAVSACGFFAVNVLGEGDAALALRFAQKGGEKFDGVRVSDSGCGAPILDDAIASLECRVVEEVSAATHVVFLAEVERASAREGTPLAYFRGRYGRLELAEDAGALREIRTRVLRGDVPVGEPLDPAELSTRFRIGEGPVHHALATLAGEGVLGRGPGGEFLVPPLTHDAVAGALRARSAIESGAAALTVGHVSANDLNQARTLVEQMPAERTVQEWLEDERLFGDLMVRLSGSPELLDAHRRIDIEARFNQLRRGAGAVNGVKPPQERRFTTLLDAYEAEDLPGAIDAIHRRADDIARVAGDVIQAAARGS
jgi:flavin reductase (DIM6/NTAB) family NADH-FMN oxidoreductase RutF/DNA-binding GntR family transcriptional regulator